MQGFMRASALIGTILGCFIATKPSDLFGRKKCLKIAGILFLVSAFGCAAAWDFWSLVFFQTFSGVGIGATTAICPLYLTEITPPKHRRRLGAFLRFNILLGILLPTFPTSLSGL